MVAREAPPLPPRMLPRLVAPDPVPGWHDATPVPEPPPDYQADYVEPDLDDCGCSALPAHSVEDCPTYVEARMSEEEAAFAKWQRDHHGGDLGGDPAADLHLSRLRARLLSTDELIDLPPPEPLIEGVLMKNTLAVLWGKPGSGKSFVSVDWGMSLGSSSWWFGRAVPAEWSRVLYLAGEGGPGLGLRADAWMIDRNVHTMPNVEWLPGSVNLLDRKWADAMVALAVELKPVLVVVDTLARAMVGGDENSARDMGMLIDTGAAIQQATTSAVLLVHHDSKAGGTMRGSSALLGAVDTSIECVSDGQAVTLKCEKQKDGRQFEPIRLWREEVSDSCVIRSHSGVGPSGELTAAQETLRRVAWDCCGTDGLPPSELMRTADQAHGTFYRSLKALVTAGELVNVGTDKRPRYRPPQVVTP